MFSEERKKYIYLSLLPVFIIVATIISSSYSRDSANYNLGFKTFGSSGWSALFSEMSSFEAFFLIISKSLYQLGLAPVYLFLIYATLSVSIKFYLIDTHSKDKWLSLAFFASYFFMLNDSTQIRFSLAVAFVYLGLHFLAQGKKLVFSAMVIFSVIMFHVACLPFIIMLLFTTKKSSLWLFGLIFLAVLLYPMNLNGILSAFLSDVINYFNVHGTFLNKLYVYMFRPSQPEFLGIFKPTMILVYISAVVIYQYRDKFTRYDMLCYNALLLSIFFYILLKDIVDLQVRFRDMFFFSFTFLIPYIHMWLSEYIGRRNAYFFLLLTFSLYIIRFIFHDNMLVF